MALTMTFPLQYSASRLTRLECNVAYGMRRQALEGQQVNEVEDEVAGRLCSLCFTVGFHAVVMTLCGRVC